MNRVAHLIGNGDNALLYKPAPGLKFACNVPPFHVEDMYATFIVDFKMCKAIQEGSVLPPGEWICGARPKKFSEMHPGWYMKYAQNIKTFYLTLPKYAENYTDFNCGHMGAHYIASRIKPDEINLYGFDSMFDLNLRSYSDTILNSDRGNMNNVRLSNNWRSIWPKMFEEFPNIKWRLHHKHDAIKFPIPSNVEIVVHSRK
jgi:hypothetical protein